MLKSLQFGSKDNICIWSLVKEVNKKSVSRIITNVNVQLRKSMSGDNADDQGKA